MFNCKTYNGNCHCGAIRFTANVSPPLEKDHEVVSCSICIRGADWHIYLPKDRLKFVRGEDQKKSYRYLDMNHNFCPTCGSKIDITMADPQHPYADQVALNVRMFRDIDYNKIKVRNVNMKDKPPEYDPDTLQPGL